VNLALKEFSRVLKSKGELLITLPDIQSVAKHVAFGNLEEVLYISPAGPITALDVMYGFGKRIEEGHHFMAHKTAFTAQTLGQKIAAAGFVNVKVHSDPVFNLWASANKK
jgi:ubiquinone/menaquinone biosynthesis C-methylase UbiE